MCIKMSKVASDIIKLMEIVYSVCPDIALMGTLLFVLVHCQIIEDNIIDRKAFWLLFHTILALVIQIGQLSLAI